MLRKFAYFRYFQDVASNRLFFEIQKLGFRKSLPREQILQILEENEINQYEFKDESKPAHSFYFSRLFLCHEIQKRDISINTEVSSLELVNILKSLLERNQEPKNNLLYLLISYNYNFEQIKLHDMLEMLKLYRNPYVLSQDELSYLMNVGEFTEEIWKYLENKLNLMEFNDLLVAMQALSSFHHHLEKRYSRVLKEVPLDLIQIFMKRTYEVCNSASAYEIAVFANSVKLFFPGHETELINAFQNKVIEKIVEDDIEISERLKAILPNLPKDSFLQRPEMIRKMVKNIDQEADSLWIGDMIEVFLGINRSGFKMDFGMGNKFHNFTVDFFRILDFDYLLNVYKSFIEGGIMNEYLSTSLLEAVHERMKPTTSTLEKIIDLAYCIHKNNLTYYILKDPDVFLKAFSITEFSFEYLSKLHIVLFPHMTSYHLLNQTIETLKQVTQLGQESNYKDLIMELQDSLLLVFNDSPIYNYQLDSYREPPKEELKILATELNKIIKKFDPSNPLVFRCFLSIPSNVSQEEFKVQLNIDNIHYISKCAWFYKPGSEISNKLLNFINENQEHIKSDYEKLVFYLLSSGGDKELVNLNKISQNSSYYLPIHYDLGKPIQATSQMAKNVFNDTLTGEALIKSLLICIDSNIDAHWINKLASNLIYKPRLEPALDIKIINKVIFYIETKNLPIDLESYLGFVRREKKMILPQFIKMIEKRLKADKNNLYELLDENYSKITKTSNKSKNIKLPDLDSKDLIGNVKALIKLNENKILDYKIFDNMNEFIIKTENEEDFMLMLSPYLTYSSEFKYSPDVIMRINSKLNKFKFWDKLSDDDLVNLLYIDSNMKTKMILTDEIKKRIKIIESQIIQKDTYNIDKETGLRFYSPFIYHTVYEKRFLVDVEMETGEVPCDYLEYGKFDLCENHLRNIKLFFGMKAALMTNSEVIIPQLENYFYQISNSKDFKQARLKLQRYFWSALNLDLTPCKANTELNFKSALNFVFNTNHHTKSSVIILEDVDFMNNIKGVSGLLLPVKTLCHHFEKELSTKLYPISIKDIQEDNLKELSSHFTLPKKTKTGFN